MKIVALLILLMPACQDLHQEKNPYQYYKKSADHFSQFINPGALPQTVDRSKVRFLVNHSYPMELALFQDGQFYYVFETLGDGKGKWDYTDGHLHLYAGRKRFVMKMDIHSVEEQGNQIAIDFHDRYGPNYLPLDRQELR